MTLVVESIFNVLSLMWLCSRAIASSQAVITFSHSTISIIQSNSFACFKYFNSDYSYFKLIMTRWFHFLSQASWKFKCNEDFQFNLWFFLSSSWFWSDSSSEMSSNTWCFLILSFLFDDKIISTIYHSLLSWHSKSTRHSR